MTGVIEQLCEDAEIKIKIGKEEQTMPCPVGAKQGDNVALVLFLFLTQALSKQLEKEWKKTNVTIPEFRHFPNPGLGGLLGQESKGQNI
jgi:hypothetical protein